jgi:transcription antitermination factor NusG
MVAEPEINTLMPPAHGTDDREARSLAWFAARTQMNCERKAEREFQRIAQETYLPVQEEVHQWSDRKRKVQRVVIPMILFVKMDCTEAKKVHKSPYFYGFLGYDRHDTIPAPISDHDIETLRFMLGHSDNPVSIEPLPLHVGDKVRVARGKLKGLEGNIITCHEGDTFVVVKLDILGCAKVKIDANELEHFV